MMKAVLMTLVLASMLPTSGHAETAQEKGLAIANEIDVRDSGWGDQSANMKMTLRNKQGDTSSMAGLFSLSASVANRNIRRGLARYRLALLICHLTTLPHWKMLYLVKPVQ